MTRNIGSRLDDLESALAPAQETRIVWANSRGESERLAAATDADPTHRVLIVRWLDPHATPQSTPA